MLSNFPIFRLTPSFRSYRFLFGAEGENGNMLWALSLASVNGVAFSPPLAARVINAFITSKVDTLVD